MITPTTPATVEAEIEEFVASCYHDPLRWVRGAYPWGEKDTPLEHEEGPDDNQIEFLTALGEEVRARAFNGRDPVMPVMMAETSGHGTGKTATEAWMVGWILSTRPFSDLTVTAGGYAQLEARTWPAIQWWMGLCITAPWFDVMEQGIYARGTDARGLAHATTWKAQMQSCKEQNAQAFAGQHARRSTSAYIFDESSLVPDKVWETAYGGMTDGEPMIMAFGQCTRNTGEFYRINFGSLKARWNQRRVDSRTSRFTNKEKIQQEILDYGIESDFVRVRVLGYAPSADELQYIDKGRVDAARARTMVALRDDPIVAGFDVSGGGKAWNVIRFRQGLNGDVLPPIRMAGEKDPDRSARIAICSELLSDRRPGHQIAAMFVDSAFGAAIVTRLHALGFTNVHEINFGGAAPDPHDSNMRASIHRKCKEWLLLGALPDDDLLCSQLCLAGFHLNNAGKLVIESKQSIQERGEQSPDDSDAFMLTFAQQVAVRQAAPAPYRPPGKWG